MSHCLLKIPQLNLCSQPFPGIRASVIMHTFIERQWTPLVDLRNNFLTHTVISPSYYDSHCSFILYHCSSWPTQCFLSTLPGFKDAIPALCCAPNACWYHWYLCTSLRFLKYLYLTWNLMQNKTTKLEDPAIFTSHSITKPIFTIHQEYNNEPKTCAYGTALAGAWLFLRCRSRLTGGKPPGPPGMRL